MMPRFVILRHEVPQSFPRPSHWDFMLEVEDVLLTWSLPQTPAADRILPVASLSDHRKVYLDYEGAISGGRGCVRRWDWGDFDWLERTDDQLKVRLRGTRLQGTITMQRTTSSRTWQLAFVPDRAIVAGNEVVREMDPTDRANQRG